MKKPERISAAEEALINAQAIEDDTVFTDEELARFRPAAEVLPPKLYADLLEMNRRAGVRGRPKATVTKEAVKIRLDADVLLALRATGDGWQTRVNDTLRASLHLAGRV